MATGQRSPHRRWRTGLGLYRHFRTKTPAARTLGSGRWLLVAPVCEEIRTDLPAEHEDAFGIEKLNYVRSSIPAVTHVDYSARVQTVDPERNPLLHDLLTRFHQKTGCAVLINTSFNVRSEPIVCSPADAYRCFMMTDMDVLVMGRHVVRKDNQRQLGDEERAAHLAQFQLD